MWNILIVRKGQSLIVLQNSNAYGIGKATHELSPLRQLLPDDDSGIMPLSHSLGQCWSFALASLCSSTAKIMLHKSPWAPCLVLTHSEPITEAHSCLTDPGGEDSPHS